MVRDAKRHEGPFVIREFDYRNLYFVLSHKGKPYAYCHAQIEGNFAYSHLYVERFGKEILKEMRKDFELLKVVFKNMGVTFLAGTRELSCADKWRKFIRLIGFEKVYDAEVNGTPCKLALMEI